MSGRRFPPRSITCATRRVAEQTLDLWFTELFDTIDMLYEMPKRHPVDKPYSRQAGFEVRRLALTDTGIPSVQLFARDVPRGFEVYRLFYSFVNDKLVGRQIPFILSKYSGSLFIPLPVMHLVDRRVLIRLSDPYRENIEPVMTLDLHTGFPTARVHDLPIEL